MTVKSTTTVKTRCPAKVNLTFEILGLLPDGYHEVRTLLQSVALEDELTFEFSPGDGEMSFQSIESEFEDGFPQDGSNLIFRAIEKYQQAVPEARSVNTGVSIVKRIPIGAGLAGGSANAAAALTALNHLCKNRLSFEELTAIGASLGADVPFCLKGGTCIGTHKGDVLTPVDHQLEFVLVLVKPHSLAISTPWAFQEYDKRTANTPGPTGTAENTTTNCMRALQRKRIDEVSAHLFNDLEATVVTHYEELELLRTKLEEFGATAARLTGSGPTLYGLLADRFSAASMIAQLGKFQIRKSDEMETEESSIYPLDIWLVDSSTQGARVV